MRQVFINLLNYFHLDDEPLKIINKRTLPNQSREIK